jgi:hypothetical protein
MEFTDVAGGNTKVIRTFSLEELGSLIAKQLEEEFGEGLGEQYSIAFNWKDSTVTVWGPDSK